MSKVISFLVIVPIMVLLIFKAVLFYEFEAKQRYIKDLTDNLTYKVKITGVLTSEEYTEYLNRLNKISRFTTNSVVLKKGRYVDGAATDWVSYAADENLTRGQAFMIYVKSMDVSLFSRLHNRGVMSVDEQNLYFIAKAQCRIEKDY